jgi:hypothetical protein
MQQQPSYADAQGLQVPSAGSSDSLQSELAACSRIIFDLLLIQSESAQSSQQELIDVALEIVVELLEKECYEERDGEQLFQINDTGRKD